MSRQTNSRPFCYSYLLFTELTNACYKSFLCSFALRQLCRKCVLWPHPPTGEHMEVVYHVLLLELMPGDRQEMKCFLVLLPRQNSPLTASACRLYSTHYDG